MPLSDLIDVSVVGSLGGIEMDTIPGLIPGLKCHRCGGQIILVKDTATGDELRCLQSNHPYYGWKGDLDCPKCYGDGGYYVCPDRRRAAKLVKCDCVEETNGS